MAELKQVVIQLDNEAMRATEKIMSALESIAPAAASSGVSASFQRLARMQRGIAREQGDFARACGNLAARYDVDYKIAFERLALISQQSIRPWTYWVNYFELNGGWIDCPENELLKWAERTRIEQIARMVGGS